MTHKSNRDLLDSDCKCCDLVIKLLDIVDAEPFEHAVPSLIHALARKLQPEMAAAPPDLETAAMISAMMLVNRQLGEVLSALGSSDRPVVH